MNAWRTLGHGTDRPLRVSAVVEGGEPNPLGSSGLARFTAMACRVSGMLDLDFGYLSSRQDRRSAWALGKVHDSARGFTGWFGKVNRAAMQTASEAIHASVWIRMAEAAATIVNGGAYAPASLRGIAVPQETKLPNCEKDYRWPIAEPDHSGDGSRPKPAHINALLLG